MSTYVRDDDDRAQTLREVMALRDATIEEMEKVIEQRNRMCSDYFEGHTTNMKRIEELEEVAQRRLEYIDKKNERIEELETLISIKDKLLDSHIQQIRTLEAALAKEQNKP